MTQTALNQLKNLIHKDLFELKTKELEVLRKKNIEYNKIINGKYSWKFYLKNFLNFIEKDDYYEKIFISAICFDPMFICTYGLRQSGGKFLRYVFAYGRWCAFP